MHRILNITKKAIGICFVLVLSLSMLWVPSSSMAKGNPKYASILIDADTGMVLHARYADKSLHPASLTKVMTLLLVFEALEGGRLELHDRIRISKHAASMVPSKLGLKPGSSIRVKDAIYALVTKSANDVAVAIAEHLGGSERGFAQMMNRKAIKIGMRRTTFVNASGLHNKRQVSTARDMAKMAGYVINGYPEYYRYFSRKNFSYQGKNYRNHNRLMSSYKGMDGMKTGYVAASGFNLIASAVRNNRRVIGVVFGGRTSKTRNAHMEVLLDKGFAKINEIRIANAHVPIPQRKPVTILAAATQVEPTPAIQSASLKAGQMAEMIGQGDFDPNISNRIEAGLMAAAAYQGQHFKKAGALKASPQVMQKIQPQAGGFQKASLTAGPSRATQQKSAAPWSIQIGAFTTRDATSSALHKTLAGLPKPYNQAQPLIAPMKTAQGWLFRGRLTGYTRSEALAACNYIESCLPVAPNN